MGQTRSHEKVDNVTCVKNENVLILLSGGIDSATCTALYLSQRFSVSALFVDYGQISAKRESAAASSICTHYRIPLHKIVTSGFKQWSNGFIPGRNAYLLYTALMAFSHETGFIAIGIHSSSSYRDCSQQFIHQIQSSFDLYTNGCIRIGVPFLYWTKKTIWDCSRLLKVPVELTYSCELGMEQPCGQCMSCKDLEALYAS